MKVNKWIKILLAYPDQAHQGISSCQSNHGLVFLFVSGAPFSFRVRTLGCLWISPSFEWGRSRKGHQCDSFLFLIYFAGLYNFRTTPYHNKQSLALPEFLAISNWYQSCAWNQRLMWFLNNLSRWLISMKKLIIGEIKMDSTGFE